MLNATEHLWWTDIESCSSVKHINDRTQAENFLSSSKCRPIESAAEALAPFSPLPPPLAYMDV